MLYATMQEMLVTLPPDDERELLVLIGQAVAAERDGEQAMDRERQA